MKLRTVISIGEAYLFFPKHIVLLMKQHIDKPLIVNSELLNMYNIGKLFSPVGAWVACTWSGYQAYFHSRIFRKTYVVASMSIF